MVSTEYHQLLGRRELTSIKVPIVTVETSGANCFYSSIALNNDWAGSFGVPDEVDAVTEDGVKIAHLKKLTSKATSLAATSPSPGVVKMALARGGSVRCLIVPDEMTMSAACSFAGNVILSSHMTFSRLIKNWCLDRSRTEEHKMLAELAWAATLTPAYEPGLMQHLLKVNDGPRTVVFIVCGGFKISLKEMEEYRTIVQRELELGKNDWECACNGERWSVPKIAFR